MPFFGGFRPQGGQVRPIHNPNGHTSPSPARVPESEADRVRRERQRQQQLEELRKRNRT